MPTPDEKRMSLGEHLEELRRRVFYALAGPAVGFVACFFLLREHLLYAILNPPYPTFLTIDAPPLEFNLASPYDAFVTAMITSLIAGIILTSPWSIYHLWAFIAAGLYEHERRHVRVFGVVSVLLFLAGAAFFYYVVYPLAVSFLYGFTQEYNEFAARWAGRVSTIEPTTLLGGYVHFVMLLMLVFGLMFELPLVVLFLGRIGIVDVATFSRYRRHVILGLVILAAIVTPPDVFSQIALAVPMWILYEAGIIILRLTERRKMRQKDASPS
ncbi:MAG: twin-arginine translocase subunit TatC [Planctomycetes bacterium]|nr:twin-arginine translocase subunit TatC [Planctomycetota bacterium]